MRRRRGRADVIVVVACGRGGCSGRPAAVARRRAWRGRLQACSAAAGDRCGGQARQAGGQAPQPVGAGGRGGRVRAGGRARACVRWAKRGAAGLGHEPLAGSTAPPIRARHCRAMMRGASPPRPDRWRSRAGHVTGQGPWSLPRTQPRRALMHGATALIRRAVRIGAAKSVRFKKNSVSFKISLKIC